MDISIIIVTHNEKSKIVNCVDSILKSIHTSKLKIEIIVVDNASTDDTCSHLNQYNMIQLIENQKNLGYGAAINIGSNIAKGSYFLISNPDIIFPVNFFNNEYIYNLPKSGIISIPTITEIKNSTQKHVYANRYLYQHNGLNLHPTGISWGRSYGSLLNKDISTYSAPFSVSGACFLISKSVFSALNGFQSKFFLYMEEVDLCWRARLLDFPIYQSNSIKVSHSYVKHSNLKNFNLKIKLLDRNRLHTVITNYSSNTLMKIIPILILMEMAMLISFLAKGILKNKIWVYTQLIKNRNNIKLVRSKIQNSRKNTDFEIAKNFTYSDYPNYIGDPTLFNLFFMYTRYYLKKIFSFHG